MAHKHYARIPKGLKEYKGAIGAGITYLALGQGDVNKQKIQQDLVTVQFNLSQTAEFHLVELNQYHAKRDIFISALQWLQRRPKHVQLSNL